MRHRGQSPPVTLAMLVKESGHPVCGGNKGYAKQPMLAIFAFAKQ